MSISQLSSLDKQRILTLRKKQLSAFQIIKATGIKEHSVRKVLRAAGVSRVRFYPAGKRPTWTSEEIVRLRELWPRADRADIERALPRRKWANISKKASSLGVMRPSAAIRKNPLRIDPVVAYLYKFRVSRKITRPKLCARIGIAVGDLLKYELGRVSPRLNIVRAWATVLGVKDALREL